jgi:Zn-dependent M28 family amino/carboxypeptidase
VAHLLKSFSPQNEYTIELVWFNGEELGLWGSKHYVKTHLKDSIAAMINLDMTGSPTGFNAMGYDEFVPFLKELVVGLNGFNLKDSVISNPWTNSDYEPFMLAGIPTFTVLGYLDAEDVRYYHDAGDTFDKVEKKYISESSAVVTILTQELANNTTIPFRRRTERETVDLMKKFKIDETLKRQKEWPFGD